MKHKNRIKVVLRRGLGRAFVLAPLVFLTVAGAGCPALFDSDAQRAVHIRQAVVGRDGPKEVAGTEIVNDYAALAGPADLAVGDKTVTVNDATFAGKVAQGDLLLIIQMAGAAINTTIDGVGYGAVSDLNNAGHYEFVGVEGRTGNVITLACGLKKAYTRAGRTQVIRVPQYTTLTIPVGTTIAAAPWDGATGGVVAVHAEVTMDLNGSISASELGFRGGRATNNLADPTGVVSYFSSCQNGAEKGEGIGGYTTDLGANYCGRGAAANGGGGGDSHNAGGGGGANAGSIASWTGKGVMQQCGTGQLWQSAWQLDPDYIANANACTTSQGGGRGGYSYSAFAKPPLPSVLAPGDTDWGGDSRRDVGGLGGRPLANNPASNLFMGGGGGAGDGNNNAAGRGGRGGGLVFIIAGAVTGNGTVAANGENGGTAQFVSVGGDAPGGGGGGGAIVVHATSMVDTIHLSADGGRGGNQVGSGGATEVEGPGGGGGGGYIAFSGGTPTSISAAGGLAGQTDRDGMSDFPVDGATAGNAGVTNGDASSFLYCGTSVGPVTTIDGKPKAFSNVSTGSFTFLNTQTPVTYECKIDTANWVPCSASYTTPTLADGQHTLEVRSTNLGGVLEDPPVTYTWTIDTVAPVTVIAVYPANPSTSPIGTFTFNNSETPVTYECKLDAGVWAPCNTSAPTSGSYTTPVLGDGAHTLTVRATDQAGNVEQSPPSHTWTIVAGAVDAGSLDGSAGLDGGNEDSLPVFLDAQPVDLAPNTDVAPDLNPGVKDDVAPPLSLDADIDQQGAMDTESLDTEADLAGGALADAADATPTSDALTPNRDSAVPIVGDAAVVKKDAAAPTGNDANNLKVMGSGFCAVAAQGSGPRAPMLMAAFALAALLIRRRRS